MQEKTHLHSHYTTRNYRRNTSRTFFPQILLFYFVLFYSIGTYLIRIKLAILLRCKIYFDFIDFNTKSVKRDAGKTHLITIYVRNCVAIYPHIFISLREIIKEILLEHFFSSKIPFYSIGTFLLRCIYT